MTTVVATMERRLRRALPLLRCCALGAAVCVALVAEAGHGEHDGRPAPIQRESRAAAGWPLGSFTLIDHRGREFSDRALQGRWTFVLFGDTRCEPCGEALAALAGLQQRIAGTAAVKTTQVLFVSLDPDGDTQPRLREFVARFDPAFIAATGARATLLELVEETGVTVQPRPSGSLVLIGPDRVLRVEYLPPFDVKRLTAQFLKTRARG